MTTTTTTTTPSTSTTVAAPPSAREVIEWVYEFKAVTVHDTTKMFGLTSEDAERVLLAAGIVMDQDVWSLAAEHEDDPDSACDAWMDKHGPEVDSPLKLVADEPVLPATKAKAKAKTEPEPKAAKPKDKASKKKSPPKAKTKTKGATKPVVVQKAGASTKGAPIPPKPVVEKVEVEVEKVEKVDAPIVTVPDTAAKLEAMVEKITTARAKKKKAPTAALLEELIGVVAELVRDVHALKSRPTSRRKSSGPRSAAALPTVDELRAQSWLVAADGDDDKVAEHLAESLSNLVAIVEAGDNEAYRATRKKAYDRAWTLRKRAAKAAEKAAK